VKLYQDWSHCESCKQWLRTHRGKCFLCTHHLHQGAEGYDNLLPDDPEYRGATPLSDLPEAEWIEQGGPETDELQSIADDGENPLTHAEPVLS
jgi:hypothetical protein